MSHLFKDLYSESFYDKFSEVLVQSISSFDEVKFKNLIFDDKFDGYELKQRMTHTAIVLSHFLPHDFARATEAIKHIIDNLRIAGIKEGSLEFMFFPEYIAMHGIDDYELSVSAFEFITQFTSCEFSVRPYILKYEGKMLAQMVLWSEHHNNKVRRLASEGSRPRLPWAMALPNLKKDPRPILPVLNNLKQDDCEIVRRSVANSLNDISKDNPDFVIDIAKKWKGISKETDAIVKHACRTLLKQGNREVLQLFGFDSQDIELSGFQIATPRVSIGNTLEFSFSIVNTDQKRKKVRLEYGLYYRKNNGGLSRKIFKISEREIEPNKAYEIKRKQSFKRITTRRFYTGLHQLSIIINGQETDIKAFDLTD